MIGRQPDEFYKCDSALSQRERLRRARKERQKTMSRKLFKLAPVFIFSSTLFLSLWPVQAQTIEKRPDEKKRRVMLRGTGNFFTSVLRTEEPLDPPCVFLVTRRGTASSTGFITTFAAGPIENIVLQNRCAGAFDGVSSIVYRLDDVLIDGRRGGIVIDQEATSTGDPSSPGGTIARGRLEIRGSSGELEGIRGHGLSVTRATLTQSFATYWVEIELDEDR